MSDAYLPLSIKHLSLNKPLAVDVWNEHGVLLLAKGRQLESFDQMRRLAALRPMIRQSDLAHLEESGLIRPGTQLQRNPLEEPTPFDEIWMDPSRAWPALYQRVTELVYDPAHAGEGYQQSVEALYGLMTVVITGREDESLFMLLQMLQLPDYRYSALHALSSSVICHLGAIAVDTELDTRRSLCCAALTMNLGMASLQDQLSRQVEPPDSGQRLMIDGHPQESVRLLSLFGVVDHQWLAWVRSHHAADEIVNEEATFLLKIADRMVARLSPRATRFGQHPSVAMRMTYQQSTERGQQVAERLVKVFGLYPPGCYVKLRNQETAVVVRRGKKINRPLVLSVLNRSDQPVTSPQLRDTQIPDYEVVAPVMANHAPLRLDAQRLLQRV